MTIMQLLCSLSLSFSLNTQVVFRRKYHLWIKSMKCAWVYKNLWGILWEVSNKYVQQSIVNGKYKKSHWKGAFSKYKCIWIVKNKIEKQREKRVDSINKKSRSKEKEGKQNVITSNEDINNFDKQILRLFFSNALTFIFLISFYKKEGLSALLSKTCVRCGWCPLC